MGFSPEKECKKIRNLLKEEKNLVKDIPLDVFGIYVMRVIGTPSKKKAGKWVDRFEMFGFISVADQRVNFI